MKITIRNINNIIKIINYLFKNYCKNCSLKPSQEPLFKKVYFLKSGSCDGSYVGPWQKCSCKNSAYWIYLSNTLSIVRYLLNINSFLKDGFFVIAYSYDGSWNGFKEKFLIIINILYLILKKKQ